MREEYFKSHRVHILAIPACPYRFIGRYEYISFDTKACYDILPLSFLLLSLHLSYTLRGVRPVGLRT